MVNGSTGINIFGVNHMLLIHHQIWVSNFRNSCRITWKFCHCFSVEIDIALQVYTLET